MVLTKRIAASGDENVLGSSRRLQIESVVSQCRAFPESISRNPIVPSLSNVAEHAWFIFLHSAHRRTVEMDEGRTLYFRGIGRTISKEELTIYFQSRKQSGGGDISSIDLKEDEAVITFEEGDGKLVLRLFSVPLVFSCRLGTCPQAFDFLVN